MLAGKVRMVLLSEWQETMDPPPLAYTHKCTYVIPCISGNSNTVFQNEKKMNEEFKADLEICNNISNFHRSFLSSIEV